MTSRNGYEAMAMRSGGAEGNCKLGPELAARAAFELGHSKDVVAVAADFARNCLRVVSGKVAPV